MAKVNPGNMLSTANATLSARTGRGGFRLYTQADTPITVKNVEKFYVVQGGHVQSSVNITAKNYPSVHSQASDITAFGLGEGEYLLACAELTIEWVGDAPDVLVVFSGEDS